MIINVRKFVESERPHWEALEKMLRRMETQPDDPFGLEQVQEFHRLYRRASADLAQIATFASEQEIRRYLESLVARAYGEIHETRGRAHRLRPIAWFFQTFPRTFRRHVRAFWFSLGVTLVGALFGAGALALDPGAKGVLMPFSHLQGDPSERVKQEERNLGKHLEGGKTAFSSYLMTHNTQVSIYTMSLGMTWGVGTIVMLFYNGVILGAVAVDYVMAGQAKFLLGWLLPHGVIEIPAILLAGQAGLVLGGALIGWGRRETLRARFRATAPDLATLIGGVAVMLVWAGFVEAFLSQYHEPVIPYSVKIGFGVLEFGLLAALLVLGGRKRDTAPGSDPES